MDAAGGFDLLPEPFEVAEHALNLENKRMRPGAKSRTRSAPIRGRFVLWYDFVRMNEDARTRLDEFEKLVSEYRKLEDAIEAILSSSQVVGVRDGANYPADVDHVMSPKKQSPRSPRGEPKPCCGSKGPRHKADCNGSLPPEEPEKSDSELRRCEGCKKTFVGKPDSYGIFTCPHCNSYMTSLEDDE